MTLEEMIREVLALIEELNPNSEYLTSDEDIQAKIHGVINQIQLELARMKKIPAYTTETVVAGQVFELNDLEEFYQIRLIRPKNAKGEDMSYELVENMVIFAEDGTADIFYYKYPKEITKDTVGTYKFELSRDALGIMPYGVAGDLLKSDVSAQYGQVYSERYELMLNRLDPRYAMSSISFTGGVTI
jgi:hypothetical protein